MKNKKISNIAALVLQLVIIATLGMLVMLGLGRDLDLALTITFPLMIGHVGGFFAGLHRGKKNQ